MRNLSVLLAVISLAFCAGLEYLVKSTAENTYYNSYPFCCKKSPNYDPKAPTDECEDYSGCKYMGDFAVLGHESLDYVKSHNLVAFYDDADKSGKNFDKKYGGRTIQLTKVYGGKTYIFNATIADTCGNDDCDKCCTENANKKTGFLVDMEYYTVLNNLPSLDAADGTVDFIIF